MIMKSILFPLEGFPDWKCSYVMYFLNPCFLYVSILEFETVGMRRCFFSIIEVCRNSSIVSVTNMDCFIVDCFICIELIEDKSVRYYLFFHAGKITNYPMIQNTPILSRLSGIKVNSI